jgi:flagellar biosynthesis protein FlhG
MKLFREETLYQVLEVGPDATPAQIERAYRIARETYQSGSAAVHSVLSEEESAEVLRRVEEAFVVLSDARLRRDYDARLAREGRRGAPGAPGPQPPAAEPAAAAAPPAAAERAEQELPPELDEPLEPEGGAYDGTALRRVRLSRGIELGEISAITKVNEGHLRSIEANRYDELPAPVYLRGFLREYARCLNLDPKRVADGYMACREERARRR